MASDGMSMGQKLAATFVIVSAVVLFFVCVWQFTKGLFR
jgi:hypothetical protein